MAQSLTHEQLEEGARALANEERQIMEESDRETREETLEGLLDDLDAGRVKLIEVPAIKEEAKIHVYEDTAAIERRVDQLIQEAAYDIQIELELMDKSVCCSRAAVPISLKVLNNEDCDFYISSNEIMFDGFKDEKFQITHVADPSIHVPYTGPLVNYVPDVILLKGVTVD